MPKRPAVATLLLILTAGTGTSLAEITGTVRDAGTGLPIPGAIVIQAAAPAARPIRTSAEGSFMVATDGSVDLLIRASGYEPAAIATVKDGAHVDVLLRALHGDVITVTARGSEQRLTETAQSVITLSQETITHAAAPTVDDVLRQVPGFSLFRRTGSRVANPTAQGVSLRGLGPSGASRSLVLFDGIPLNDPFGGWISWGRVPRVSLGEAEILRGGGSELYGSSALSGVISLVPRTDAPAVSLDIGAGSQDLEQASLYAALRLGRTHTAVAAEHLRTTGYTLVRAQERGPIDAPAGSDRNVADLRLTAPLASGAVHIRAARFEEERNNGTPLQVNATRIDELSTGIETTTGNVTLSGRAYRTVEDYFQTFSAVASERTSERLTRTQNVPASATGGSFVATLAASTRTAISAGLDLRRVRGATEEIVAATGARVTAGGTMESRGGFVQLLRQQGRFSLDATIRFDAWTTDDAFRTSGTTRTALDSREDSALSPRISILWDLNDQLSLSSSVYRGFRAPTLNELYRSFRVGNVVTEANELLQAETVSGFEIGAHVLPRSGTRLRLNAFWMELEDPVANITISSSPELIRRRRVNLGRTRSRGIELDGQLRPFRTLELDAGYLYVDAKVLDFDANPAIEGLRIPQVPAHQLSASARLSARDFTAALQARTASEQYEDDRNSLSLGEATTVDLLLESRPIRHLSFYGAVENLLDERYAVGRTPVTTLGPPRQFRVGLRYER